MIARIIWILTGLLAIGVVATFLLYVSVLTLMTTVAIMMGLLATLILGYLAGVHTAELEPEPELQELHASRKTSRLQLEPTKGGMR